MIQCPKCGTSFPHISSSPFCEICGHPLTTDSSITYKLSNCRRIPWENIEALGLFKALYITTSRCLFKPSQFFSDITEKSSAFQAWLFGLIAGSIGTIFDLLWRNPTANLFSILSEYGIDNDFSYVNVQNLIYSPIIIAVYLTIIALYCHIILAITRSKKQNFSSTFIVVCYTQSIAILNIIPFIGNMIAPFWSIYILIAGISRVHGITKTRACLTILLPFILFALFITLVIATAMGGFLILGTIFKEIFFNLR